MSDIAIIDPHLHLFDLALGEYNWLKQSNPPFWQDKRKIARDFDESHLALTPPLKLASFVHIEAGFSNQNGENELAWLESTVSSRHKAIGVIDLTLEPADFKNRLATMRKAGNFVGVRHILDEDAETILIHPNCQPNLAELAKHSLVFECQYLVEQANNTNLVCQFASLFPSIRFIINHAGFPSVEIGSASWHCWQEQLIKLAQYNNIAIKCSGWEMTNRQYSPTWQQKVIENCLNSFGANRVMLASNFPLTLFSQSYQDYWQSIVSIVENIDTKLVKTLCYESAHQWYKL